jgi:hypothetical protein
MPTSATLSFSQDRIQPARAPETAVPWNYPLVSGTYAKGTLIGRVTATGYYGPYNNAASDGTEVARAILEYGCIVDASHNVTIGATASASEWGQTLPTAPCYVGGYFACEDIPNIDASAVTDLGRIVEGNITTGILRAY